MPTYDYICRKCGHEYEKFQSITAKPEKKCPECSGPVERKIGGGAGIIFKGSGFYQTDYRSSKYQESAKKDKPSAPSTDSSCGSGNCKKNKTGS